VVAWRGQGMGEQLTRHLMQAMRVAGYLIFYLFSTGAGGYWTRLGIYEVPVAEVVAALPNAPQVRYYDERGWLPTEIAWRYDL
jgi:predicted N-acetyltransferase YhbS